MPFVAGLDLRVADATNGTAWFCQTLYAMLRALPQGKSESKHMPFARRITRATPTFAETIRPKANPQLVRLRSLNAARHWP